ncbi:MAG: SDR family oxidoreductase [Myxococcota bacterium]
MLNNKVMAVFAAGGAVAGAVAREWARQGARVFVSGRRGESVEALVEQIREEKGAASGAVVDALDDAAIGSWLDAVIAECGQLDGVFNGIGGRPQELGYPALSNTQPLEDFMLPITRIAGSQFLTARHGAQRMNHGGAVVLLSATLSGMAARHMAGISATCGAVEALTRSLAGEYGPQGVRINCLRASAMPETRTIQETGAGLAALSAAMQAPLPPLGRPTSVSDTAHTAAFLVSDHALGMTGQVVTVCGGAFVG